MGTQAPQALENRLGSHQVRSQQAHYAAGGVYVNALGDEPAERVRSAYGSNWVRLTRVKRRYDPENVFRHNANIEPASG